MSAETPRKCQKSVYSPDGRGFSWPCNKKAFLFEKSKYGKTEWHCKMHSNAAYEARDAKRDARWAKERAIRDKKWARQGAESELMRWARTPEARLLLPRAALDIVEKYEASL